jgi:hypothetical protein
MVETTTRLWDCSGSPAHKTRPTCLHVAAEGGRAALYHCLYAMRRRQSLPPDHGALCLFSPMDHFPSRGRLDFRSFSMPLGLVASPLALCARWGCPLCFLLRVE